MKRIAVLGILVALSCGCGRSWLPRLRGGAPCRETCAANVLPAQPTAGCVGCGSGYGTGYSAYDGEVLGDAGYYGSSVVAEPYLVAPSTGVSPNGIPMPSPGQSGS